jgi:SAM-dependent methyltransferase
VNEHVATIIDMAGLRTPMALRVAVTLGLPDRLRGGATLAQLATDVDASPVALGLLLNHLVTLGIAERTETGYRTTELGAALHTDADNGLTNFLHLDLAGGRGELALVEMLHSIRTGESGYVQRYGRDFWADLTEHPHLRASFDKQMTDRFRDQVPGIVAGFDWSRFPVIVDVGGGQGTLLAAILAAHHGVRGNLVDLDPTATEALRTFRAQRVEDRADVTPASFFDPLPPGADAYLLCDILHDWDDEHAHQILDRCTEAMPPTGRIVVVEPVGGRRASTEYDLTMLVIFGGRERRVEEFQALAEPHNLVLDTVLDLTDQRCLVEFRRA